MKFFCPQCLEPVQLKIGHSKIPHFAHLTNNKCSQLFQKGNLSYIYKVKFNYMNG
ncbi:competence protein CoiA family protein [Lysinibacillus irui]